MHILADNYFLVRFAWLLAIRLKEYFHLPKASFYLQPTLVSSGEEDHRMDQRAGYSYPQGSYITCNIELIKNACLSTKNYLIKSLHFLSKNLCFFPR